MPAPLAALAGRLAGGMAARGGASAMSRGTIMRSAMSMGHGVSSSQFSPPQPDMMGGTGDNFEPSYSESGTARWS